MKRACPALVVLLATSLVPAPALAYHDEALSHACPIRPTKQQDHFASDFKVPEDYESTTDAFKNSCDRRSWDLAGFGGAQFQPVPDREAIPGDCKGSNRTPVIFVHGNVVDAGDWYPALPVFAELGYTMCELWGLSYNGVGSNNGGAYFTRNATASSERGDAGNSARITNNELNVPDLAAFIKAVLAYTRAKRFSLVSHSLGVTLARFTLKRHPELLEDLEAFVGIAGGNDGTTLCRGNEPLLGAGLGTYLMSCDEITPDMPGVYDNQWLDELNAGDETPGDARYMTVSDGSGAGDIAFLGPDAPSPLLEGALNCTFEGASHNDLRLDPVIASVYAAFVAGTRLPTVESGETPAAPLGGECSPRVVNRLPRKGS